MSELAESILGFCIGGVLLLSYVGILLAYIAVEVAEDDKEDDESNTKGFEKLTQS